MKRFIFSFFTLNFMFLCAQFINGAESLSDQSIDIELEELPSEFADIVLNNYYRGLEDEKDIKMVIDLLVRQQKVELNNEDLIEVIDLPAEQVVALVYKIIFNSTVYTTSQKQELIREFIKGRELVSDSYKQDLQFINDLYLGKTNANILQGIINSPGNTLLFNAVQEGKDTLLTMLFDHGLTVLDYDVTSILNLIGKGPSKNPAHLGMRDLMSIAIANNQAAVIEVLLAHAAGIETRNQKGNTPLVEAALDSKADIIELLLKHGADVDATDKKGWAPLHIASAQGDLASIEILLNAHVDINQVTAMLATPLHIAVAKGQTEVVKFLINHGALLDERNMARDTPLDTAERIAIDQQEPLAQKMEEIIELLERP